MLSICENESCSKEFEQKSPYQSKWSKTCSYKCSRELADKNMKAAYEAKGKVELVKAHCELDGCGREFEHRWHKPQKFCSRECSNKARSGENHPADALFTEHQDRLRTAAIGRPKPQRRAIKPRKGKKR